MPRATAKFFLKCPCCGHNVPRLVFTRGALGHSLQALTQEFVGHERGTNRGAIIWHRRPMNHDEVIHVARAVATATQSVTARLESGLPEPPAPEEIMAELSDAEAVVFGQEWLKEIDEEQARCRALIEADLQRRGLAHG